MKDEDLTKRLKQIRDSFPNEVKVKDIEKLREKLDVLTQVGAKSTDIRTVKESLDTVTKSLVDLATLERATNVQQNTNSDKLEKTIKDLAKTLGQIPSQIKIPEVPDNKKELKELKDAIKAQKLDPKIEVKPAEVNIDLSSVTAGLQAVMDAVGAIEIPEPAQTPETDLSPVTEALSAVESSIEKLYNKPQLTPTFNHSAIVDAIDELAGGLTDTELRAAPVKVDDDESQVLLNDIKGNTDGIEAQLTAIENRQLPDGHNVTIDNDNTTPVPSNLYKEGLEVSAANPVNVTGTLVTSGAELTVNNALEATAYDLNAAAYSATTAITGAYLFNRLELNFTTAVARDITITSTQGTILYKTTSDTSLNFNIDGEDDAFESGDQITVDITQTAGACLVDVTLVISKGQLPLSGNPSLGEGTSVIGTTKDFLLEVAQGNVTGRRIQRIIARNPDVDTIATEDIWFNGGTLTYLTSAERMNVKSTSTSDTSAGTGARTIRVTGLDANYDEIEETVTLNGTTNVLTANSYLRVHIVDVITAGTNGAPLGEITLTAQTAATIHANLPVGENRNGKSHYTVPAGKTAYLLDFLPSMAAGKTGCDIIFQARPFGEVFKMVSRIAVQSSGTSGLNHDLTMGPPKFTEKTDIRVRASASANDQDVFSEYILLLVDN